MKETKKCIYSRQRFTISSNPITIMGGLNFRRMREKLKHKGREKPTTENKKQKKQHTGIDEK